jgi:His/Glu/Gln/Arg/opine family amino acid ABC transporter permease subunit
MTFDLAVLTFGLPILLKGLVNTILFCAIAIVCGFVIACLIALSRLSRRWFLRLPALWFVEFFRNTPFLVQAFILFFAFPRLGIRIEATLAGILVLSLYAGAYFSESIRGAILSVPKGQLESARALGMPYLRAMRRIVLPQSLGYLLPATTNQIIGVIKDSAALSVITVPELSMAAQVVLGVSFSPVETYVMVALLYWALTACVSALMVYAERRVAARAPASHDVYPDGGRTEVAMP